LPTVKENIYDLIMQKQQVIEEATRRINSIVEQIRLLQIELLKEEQG